MAKSVDKSTIAENGFNLSVNTYVEAKDKREVVDIAKLNEEITQTVSRIATLRTDIDAIINEIEG